MTIVGTDSSPWLEYILSQFVLIQEAQIVFKFRSTEPTDLASPFIRYGTPGEGGIQVPSSESLSQFSVKEAEAILESDSDQLPFDLFRLAFTALSRIEEYEEEQTGKKLLSYSSRHPHEEEGRFDRPYVNLLFEFFEKRLKIRYPQLSFGDKKKPVLAWSHDLDYISKTIQLRLKQTAFNKYNTFRALFGKGDFKRNFVKTFSFFFSNPSYWCFDYWNELEKKYDQQSTYYIYAASGSKELKTWLIDPSYKIARNTCLQSKLRELMSEGHQIGLHGSFNSATDGDLLRKGEGTARIVTGSRGNQDASTLVAF